MAQLKLDWAGSSKISSKSFKCGHCGNAIASEKGYMATYAQGSVGAYIYICHVCTRPTFLETDGRQTPGILFGDSVSDILDKSVEKMYEEGRQAFGASAYTACVLCCRKLLMHIAVSKGASAGNSFASYVEYLSNHNYVPPDAKMWIDHIRTKGNEANHEIFLASKEEAEELLSFSEILLKIIFQFPATAERRIKPKP
jgi:hypothetical protein